MTKIEDKALIKGILNGNERSLSIFYRHFSPKLQIFIKRKIGFTEDAEEILQDTLLACLESLRDFTFKCSLNTFIHSIAKNKIIDFYRKKKLKKILFSQLPQLESILSNLKGPEEIYENKQAKLLIDKAFHSLRPKYRQILALKYFEGRSVTEITGELKLSFKSAESMLFRARKAFAKALNLI